MSFDMTRYTALIHTGEPEEGGFWATCLEVLGANGQGETKAECLDNLAEAIRLIMEVNREQAFLDDPNAVEEILTLA